MLVNKIIIVILCFELCTLLFNNKNTRIIIIIHLVLTMLYKPSQNENGECTSVLINTIILSSQKKVESENIVLS